MATAAPLPARQASITLTISVRRKTAPQPASALATGRASDATAARRVDPALAVVSVAALEDDLATGVHMQATPASVVDAESRQPDQTWFWTPQWQAKEREADADIAAVGGVVFGSDEEFIAHLDSVPPPESK